MAVPNPALPLATSIAFFSNYLWAARQKLFATWVGEQQVGHLVRRNGAGQLAYAIVIGVAFAGASVSLASAAWSRSTICTRDGRSPPPAEAPGI
jgi:hypothetical protein